MEILDHEIRLQENVVRKFLGLETRLLCSKEHVGGSVMVEDCIVDRQ